MCNGCFIYFEKLVGFRVVYPAGQGIGLEECTVLLFRFFYFFFGEYLVGNISVGTDHTQWSAFLVPANDHAARKNPYIVAIFFLNPVSTFIIRIGTAGVFFNRVT